MKIYHVSSEFAPFAKSGGLGDAVAGLCKELARKGVEIHVLLPKYDFLNTKELEREYNHLHLHFLELPPQFKMSRLYGFPDDAPRFLQFSKIAFEYLKNQKVDVLHLHDWHAAALAALCRENGLPIRTIALSLHNLEYQGKCGLNDLKTIGIQKTERFQGTDPLYPDSYNILRGGLEWADQIFTVSPTYAKEILTPEFGFGLESVIAKRKDKLVGILNGIDEEIWSPSPNAFLKTPYKNSDHIEAILAAKQKTRESFAHLRHLKGAPWFGSVTRLASQKGPELLLAAMEEVIRLGGVFALLGSADPADHAKYLAIKQKYEGHPHVFFELIFDDCLAHQLYAALDFILIPSHFEPCGLTQLIAMRYGTIPIVHSTGGLKDTVNSQNGFPFARPTRQSLIDAMHSALHQWEESQPAHRTMILHGMKSDFSWKKPAEAYLNALRM
jgi:starch synthase